jgi:hypothetical protein
MSDALENLQVDCRQAGLARIEKIERGMAGGEFAHFDAVERLVQLRVEIVNPKFSEVANTT